MLLPALSPPFLLRTPTCRKFSQPDHSQETFYGAKLREKKNPKKERGREFGSSIGRETFEEIRGRGISLERAREKAREGERGRDEEDEEEA